MNYTNSQMRELIDEHIHSKRDREILKRRFIDGVHYEPLAEEYDMSRAQIVRIVKRGESVFEKLI